MDSRLGAIEALKEKQEDHGMDAVQVTPPRDCPYSSLVLTVCRSAGVRRSGFGPASVSVSLQMTEGVGSWGLLCHPQPLARTNVIRQGRQQDRGSPGFGVGTVCSFVPKGYLSR